MVASQLGADYGYMILFGLIAAIPAMIIGGPIWGSIISKSIHVELPQHEQIDDNQRVGKGRLVLD
ncbi:hypothetical protein P4S63_20825 [Pseudoalteromonas sp. B193]